jgi:hypothetical protein
MFGNGKRWSGFGLLLACSLGLLGFFGAWNKLAMRITRTGTNVSPSTSMDLYRVNLRYQMRIKQSNGEPELLTWELDIPRAYVFDENGTNGTAFDPARGAETEYGVVFRLRADETLTKFVPDTLSKQGGNGVRDILLGLGNYPSSLADKKIVFGDMCVVVDERPSDCTSRDYRCSISFQLDGWVVSANVTHDLFMRPVEACAMGKRFLQQYSIKRDDARALRGETP